MRYALTLATTAGWRTHYHTTVVEAFTEDPLELGEVFDKEALRYDSSGRTEWHDATPLMGVGGLGLEQAGEE